MHTGTINAADRFLPAWIPKIIDSRGFNRGGVVFITWDESHGDSSGCCVPGIHGGRTALIAIAPRRHHNTRINHHRTAYSLQQRSRPTTQRILALTTQESWP
jgi:hypothetical protein